MLSLRRVISRTSIIANIAPPGRVVHCRTCSATRTNSKYGGKAAVVGTKLYFAPAHPMMRPANKTFFFVPASRNVQQHAHLNARCAESRGMGNIHMMDPTTIRIGDADVNPRDVARITRGGGGGGQTSLTLIVHTCPVKKVCGPLSSTRWKKKNKNMKQGGMRRLG